MKKIILVLIIIVLIILMGVGFVTTVLYDKYSYSSERADLEEYYEISEAGSVAIVLQNEKIAEKALLRDGVYYLDFETIHTYFNERFYLDNSILGEELLIYTTTEASYRVKNASSSIVSEMGTEEMEYPVMLYENEVCYVAIDYVQRFTEMEYQVFTNPDRMQIYNEWDEKTIGTAKKDTAVRVRGGNKSEILTDVAKGDQVTILEELDSWYKVKTKDAFIGYVPKRHIKGIESLVEDHVSRVEAIYHPAIENENRLCVGWHQVLSMAANDSLSSMLAGTKVNVVAPTWFLLSGNNGRYVSNASASYVQYAHNQGVDVWAVIDNFNVECNLFEILKNTSQRDALIQNLVSECKRYGIDGINVDFEQVSPQAAEHYIQFIRELSVACHKNELVVSVDNYVPTDYTAFYNREEQGRYVDYVVIMGYDEHTSGSSEAGSVASIEFVEQGIVHTLEKVEAAKIINGVPFYSRGWKTSNDTLSVQTLTMSGQNQFIANHQIAVAWDEKTAQYYGENTIDGVRYQIWMENSESIQKKLDVMAKYDIVGVAMWKLGLETKDVWEVIGDYLK